MGCHHGTVQTHHGRGRAPAVSIVSVVGRYFFAAVSVPRSIAAVATAE
jgi:hypothetical protein